MQTERRTLLNTANEHYKQGERIQGKIVDIDYRLFADGELVLSNVNASRNLPVECSQYFRL